MMKSCNQCATKFTISESDTILYDKISPIINGKKFPVPPPKFCPDCRQQHRLAYRNEKKLYHRKCDLTGKEIISTYSADKPYVIYDQQVWWSDQWDDSKYGQAFDFNKTFFEQFDELSKKTPRPCIVNMSSENSIYTNHSAYNKNCYMCINTGYSEDLIYCSNYNLYNKNCTDCLAIQHCELCYFCVNTKNCSYSSFLSECANCTNCNFCYDCISCEDCFGCWNLRHKKYCIYNVQYTKYEYQKELNKIKAKTAEDQSKQFHKFWAEVRNKAIHKNLQNFQNENSSGDHLFGNKNVKNSFYTFNTEDSAYCYDCGKAKTCLDVTEPFQAELQYETHACNLGYNLLVCSKCYESNNLLYCQYCWYSSYLFGCFGLKHKKYCILNKQYSKEEYEKLVPKIIEHMQKTGEYGEFFPMAYSGFGYNETAANEYYPLTKNQALKLKIKWHDEDLTNRYQGPKKILPETRNITEEITKQILTCENCSKNYRIISQELKFYLDNDLPIPNFCPDCRHKTRMALRNPRKLWDRQCAKCHTHIQSSYDPARPEIVYCEKCYMEAVY